MSVDGLSYPPQKPSLRLKRLRVKQKHFRRKAQQELYKRKDKEQCPPL
jgi:hypothetical protein